MKRILLIEDEISVVTFIKKGLTEEGYEVSVSLTGEVGLQMASSFQYDLIILDIMLPDKNGLEVCKAIRQNNVKTPILFLTALGTTENVVIGLNSGADDYLVKPFKFIELHARINALIRRNEQSGSDDSQVSQHIYQIDDLIINDDSKVVTRNNENITLTATEYRLLLALIRNRGKVLSRLDLLESAWDINFDLGTNLVDVYINYLRKKIDAQSTNKLIHTVVGMGYVLKIKP
ncbi:response regulator transcription factor [Flectobacillus longus]|uniref:response regulator transcription factor n=1 Tax=Flectobacillus longus TaxID=2984207 RepID=UPI0024B668DD|nr:response regulator transcription factor [Flectobacillus longus]MDI9879264.1 response regulator transcription factor [Flectobacillus longus]